MFVVRTGWATIWKVERSNGQSAALKHYHKGHMGSERNGVELLNALGGKAAAQIYSYNASTVLLEWLDGPSLGDMTRAGKDESASQELLKITNRLHLQLQHVSKDLPDLNVLFQALFNLKFSSDCLAENRAAMQTCKALAETLLNTQQDVQPLHGDLHHDNVKLGERGYCAFDAKGVVGERCFELANAFRNPKGAATTLRNSMIISSRVCLWAEGLGVSRKRLLQWAAVKCALSIAWRSKGTLRKDSEADLLLNLLSSVNRV